MRLGPCLYLIERDEDVPPEIKRFDCPWEAKDYARETHARMTR